MLKQEIYSKLLDYFDSYQIWEILTKHTGFTKNQLFFCEQIENFSHQDLNNYIQQAKKWIPFEYIIQKAEFYNYDFFVDNRVLIPRNDTEIMIDCVLDCLDKNKKGGPVLIDVWTGSSCIAISLVNTFRDFSQSHVVDISTKALEVSKINILKYNLENKIQQHHGSLLEPLKSFKTESQHIVITANLPYIKDNDFENMSPETIQNEPSSALYWGPVTWFELYEELISQAIKLKQQHEYQIDLFIEIGFDQSEYAKNYLQKLWKDFEIYKDNSWIDRCVAIKI